MGNLAHCHDTKRKFRHTRRQRRTKGARELQYDKEPGNMAVAQEMQKGRRQNVLTAGPWMLVLQIEATGF